jgi:2-hydroxychromene-2-carboxylate isomerase
MGPKKIYDARAINAGMLYAQQYGVFRAYNDLAFERFWRRDLDPESIEAVSAALEQSGAPAGFAAFLEGEGGARHDALRAEAEASGIFGVPSFVLDGEIFWGGDRVLLLRERLDEKGVLRRR